MPLTPDRKPGVSDDEGVDLEPTNVPPSVNGGVRYVTGVGFQFFEEGVLKGLTGTGLTEAEHEALHTLTHEIVQTTYDEVTRATNGRVSAYTIWTTPAKTQKVRELLVTRDGQQRVSVLTTKQYDVFGVLAVTVTETITRGPSGRVSSISRVRT